MGKAKYPENGKIFKSLFQSTPTQVGKSLNTWSSCPLSTLKQNMEVLAPGSQFKP